MDTISEVYRMPATDDVIWFVYIDIKIIQVTEVRTGSGSDRVGTHASRVLFHWLTVEARRGVRTDPVATAPGSDLMASGLPKTIRLTLDAAWMYKEGLLTR